MSSGTVMQYTDEDITQIMFEGFNYTLEQSVIDNIQKIANEVGAPEYIRTPQFLKQNQILGIILISIGVVLVET